MLGPHSAASAAVSGSVYMNVCGFFSFDLKYIGPRNSRPSRMLRALQHFANRRHTLLDELAPLVLGHGTRRRQHGHHALQADRGGELRVFRERRESSLERGSRLASRTGAAGSPPPA